MLSFKPEEKKKMIEEIQYFLREEYDLDLGLIASENVYEFFFEQFANRAYNIGLDDAKKYYQKYANAMEDDYYALYQSID